MRFTTWNVNSIRQREDLVLDFLKRERPDLLLMQEIKCQSHQFPIAGLEALGYKAVILGQKTYNGVAIVHKIPVAIEYSCLPFLPTYYADARFLQVVLAHGLHIGNLYLPNGNSQGETGFQYKLDFMEALLRLVCQHRNQGKDLILAGDYNVCPNDNDLAPGALSANDALCHPLSRAAFRKIIWQGMSDAVRVLYPQDVLYTFWDYKGNSWFLNSGLRIDHFLLSPVPAERLSQVIIHQEERSKPHPSDHVPVTIVLS